MAELLVCAKLVYDLEQMLSTGWRVTGDRQAIPIEGVGKIMNGCDAAALELALRVKDRAAQGDVEITVLTAGGPECRKMLEHSRAVGAGRCVRLSAPERPGYLPDWTAELLCAGIRRLGRFDLILFGVSAGEYDMGQTGLLAAERLGYPVIQDALSIEETGDGAFRICHLLDDGIAWTVVRSPAVLTVGTPSDVCLRSPTLKAVLAASKDPVEVLEAAPEPPPQGKGQDWLEIPKQEKSCAFLDPQEPGASVTLVRQLLEAGGGTA